MATEQRTRTVGYVRVSTDKQADHGCSLEAQRTKLEGYAALYDLELIEVVVDAGVSAKTLDRPGLARVLAMLARGEVEAVLVAKLDRLTRSVRDLDTLISEHFARGPALLSVGEQIDTRSAAGRLVLNVLASVSQWEREAIGERTSTAMRHLSASGGFVGGSAPYGYAKGVDGKLCHVQAEQAVVSQARAWRAGRSLRQLALDLESAGMVARSGKRFQPSQLARMLAA